MFYIDVDEEITGEQKRKKIYYLFIKENDPVFAISIWPGGFS